MAASFTIPAPLPSLNCSMVGNTALCLGLCCGAKSASLLRPASGQPALTARGLLQPSIIKSCILLLSLPRKVLESNPFNPTKSMTYSRAMSQLPTRGKRKRMTEILCMQKVPGSISRFEEAFEEAGPGKNLACRFGELPSVQQTKVCFGRQAA